MTGDNKSLDVTGQETRKEHLLETLDSAFFGIAGIVIGGYTFYIHITCEKTVGDLVDQTHRGALDFGMLGEKIVAGFAALAGMIMLVRFLHRLSETPQSRYRPKSPNLDTEEGAKRFNKRLRDGAPFASYHPLTQTAIGVALSGYAVAHFVEGVILLMEWYM